MADDSPADSLSESERQRLQEMARAAHARTDASRAVRSVEFVQRLDDNELMTYLVAVRSADRVERVVASTCLAQGVPLRLEDPASCNKIAVLLRAGHNEGTA